MAHTHTHPMASFGTPLGAGALLRDLAALFSARRVRMAERARIRRELESYSDRDLRDIGIVRSDIDSIASGRYAG